MPPSVEDGLSLGRRDRLKATTELYGPPAFKGAGRRRDKAIAFLRRLVDPAAESLWRDLSRLLPRAQGTLVDVGCGAQPYRALVPVGVRYIGIDRAEAHVAFAYSFPDTIYYEGDRWPLADGAADWVLCSEVLEHVPAPPVFLAEAMRCLRPGGRMVLTVPFSARWHYIPHDYWRFTPSAIGLLLGQAGFTGVRVYARGNPLTLLCHKALSLVFPLLLGVSVGWRRWACRLAGLALSPVAVLAAGSAFVSLGWDFGDDPIGYTIVAGRPEEGR